MTSSPFIHSFSHSFVHSYIHCFIYSISQAFCIAPLQEPRLLIGAPDTARILCRNISPKRYRQLWVIYLPKVPTWRIERESNLWPFGRKASTQPKRQHTPKGAWRRPLLVRFASDCSIDTVSELTPQRTTGNYEWRTCPRFLRGRESGIQTWDFPDAKTPNLPLSHQVPWCE